MPKQDLLSLKNKVNQEVTVQGWIESIRDHGNVVFIDLRDRSAIVQVVIFAKDLLKEAKKLSVEDLILVKGKINQRPEKLINKKIPTGVIELAAEEVKLVTKSKLLPFEIDKDTRKINEIKRLKYRYLDFRSKRMQRNLKKRHQLNLFLRNYFSNQGFWEIETPYLTKGTPEGAREFIVPSRLHPGEFYVLPQSPQQFKQLLMVGGLEKYFQIVRCFRDEDQRGDRQPEFTQFDLEMSFIEEEDIITLMEEAMIKMVQELFPKLEIQEKPFPRLTYEEAMKKYNSDKPDLRTNKKNSKSMAFAWVVDFPLLEKSETENKLVAVHHPFTSPKEEDIDLMKKEPLKVRAKTYDLILNGYEIGGGSIRIHERDLQEKVFKALGLNKEEQETKFGHMLRAFEFSPPPHGGIALGLDRLIMLLCQEETIREVIAFPKTGDAKDVLMGAPAPVSKLALKEANIALK